MITYIFALYNEAERFPKNFERFYEFVKKRTEPWEVILVDDGSNDQTPSMIKKITNLHENVRWLRNTRNKGQGAAIKLGCLISKGDIIIYMDADLSASLESIPKLIQYISEGYAIALTSRWMPGADIVSPQPVIRRLLGKVYYKVIGLFFVDGIYDMNCGMKAYQGEAAKLIFGFVRSWRWAFNVETLLIARGFNFKVREFPITWSNDPRSRVHIFRDVIFTLWELTNMKLRQFIGVYPHVNLQD